MAQQNSHVLSCPFIAGPKITDPRYFVGRKEELRFLASRMSGVQPISVNIIGERRIGKSSLLYHYFQTWEQRGSDPARFVVVYISLQEADPRHESMFYRTVLRELAQRPVVQQRLPLLNSLNQHSFTRDQFAHCIGLFAGCGLLPVICLDEFEVLLKRPQQFDDSFYDKLRGLMDRNALMFVLASLHPLDSYRKKHNLTSNFFNVGHVWNLGLLRDEAVTDLVRLPASTG